MGDCNFCFLKEEYPEIFKQCLELEENLGNNKCINSIRDCRYITEQFTKEFFKEKKIHIETKDNREATQFDRINKLEEEKIFSKKEINKLHTIRKLGNKSIHDTSKIDNKMSAAYEAHKLLFEAMIMFYSNMDNHEDFEKPEYSTKFQSINNQAVVNAINTTNNTTNNITNNTTNIYAADSSNKKWNAQLTKIIIVIVIIACFGIFAYTTFDSGDNNIVSNQFSTQSNDIANPYWASADSDRFHLSSCKWAKKISDSNLITYPDRDAAIADGRIPCGECNP